MLSKKLIDDHQVVAMERLMWEAGGRGDLSADQQIGHARLAKQYLREVERITVLRFRSVTEAALDVAGRCYAGRLTGAQERELCELDHAYIHDVRELLPDVTPGS